MVEPKCQTEQPWGVHVDVSSDGADIQEQQEHNHTELHFSVPNRWAFFFSQQNMIGQTWPRSA